ncbi:acyl carrier protein [Micromonospora sp. CPCC 205546]|uniref:acyl carrier protein n=1 Tax=Micromonospora sp. CPCC 205546 TaxID=3122397 RepID=UPI002FF428AE
MTNLTTEVLESARHVLNRADLDDPDADLSEFGMDSLLTVAFMVDLETRFKVRFPAELVAASTFRTPRAASQALQSLQSAS